MPVRRAQTISGLSFDFLLRFLQFTKQREKEEKKNLSAGNELAQLSLVCLFLRGCPSGAFLLDPSGGFPQRSSLGFSPILGCFPGSGVLPVLPGTASCFLKPSCHPLLS